jgi:hypothetical protein
MPDVPHSQLSLADEVQTFELNALPDEVQRYLRTVDAFRAAGYPPSYRSETRVRYCDECGWETADTAPATHCGRTMLLVDGVTVLDEERI